MNAADTIREVRRISAGGKPRGIRRGQTFRCSAEKLGWAANPEVLRLIGEEVKKL